MNIRLKTILAFAITAIIITSLIPTDGTHKYELGENWGYNDITSEFDFQILKTREDLEKDEELFELNYTPIYTLDKQMSSQAFYNLRNKYDVPEQADSSFLSTSQQIGKELRSVLESIYNKGVISIRSRQDMSSVVRIVNNGTIKTIATSELFTPQSATDTINSHLHKILGNTQNLDVADLIIENVVYNEKLNSQFKDDEKSEISISKGFMPKGALIIKKGDFIDNTKLNILDSYYAQYKSIKNSNSSVYTIFGNFIFVAILLTLNYIFQIKFRSEFSKKISNILFVLFIMIGMMLFTRLVTHFDVLSYYMIPYAIVPLYIITFYDIRMSIFEFITVLLLCTYITPIPLELFFLNISAGMAASFIIRDYYHRNRIFVASGVILLVYSLGFIALNLMQNQTLSTINWIDMSWFIVNIGILLALYQLIYIFEHIFGFVTNITLFELCDTNKPLLQELAQKAPGTFQHSLQVANLAASAASAINANSLFARTGALYHDIGKINNPIYFIENTTGGYNPHSQIEPLKSVEFIKDHVTAGLKLAKKYKLPNVISDFIVSHHGTSKIYYFYHQYITKYGRTIDESMFLYEGPLPSSKEATICMMADSIEAASRSMKEYTPEAITELVNKIIDNQIKENQFNESPISLAEISTVKKVFINKLSNIYHTRIVYPERE